jgi:hypothetical protein
MLALLDGAIRREVLLEKADVEAKRYVERIFAYEGSNICWPGISLLPKT